MAIAYLIQPLLRTALAGLKSPAPIASFVVVGYLTLPIWLLLGSVLGLYRIFERVVSFAEVLVSLVKLHVLGVLGLALVGFVTQLAVNRSIVALFACTSFVTMASVRWVLSRWVAWQRSSGRDRERILLVGDPGPEMEEFLRRARRAALPPSVVGYLRATPASFETTSDCRLPPLMGDVGAIREVLHEKAIDQVIYLPPLSDPGGSVGAVAACEELGVVASFVVGRVDAMRSPPRVMSVYDTPVVAYVVSPRPPLLLALKQVFDVVAAAFLLVALSPLLLCIALVIRANLGSPILFSQERAGLNGRPFRMFKFRTMVADAESLQEHLAHLNETQGPTFKASNDPRITRLGHFLRRTSIDELPQLFNVLEGSMSLVGPRPLPVAEQQRIFGAHRRRLSMKPGITGLWQVSGRSDVGFDEWMRLDREYVDRWSLELDAVILLRTIPAVVSRRGAR